MEHQLGLKSLQSRVQFLMESIPATKHNGNLLLSLYWQLFDGAVTVQDVAGLTSSESITRAARHINEYLRYKKKEEGFFNGE